MSVRLLMALALGLGLSACGNDPDAGFGYKTLKTYLKGRLSGTARQSSPAPVTLTRAMLSDVTTPLLFARSEQTGAMATLVSVATNGDVVTWSTAEGITVSLRNGLLVATRGLGGDLLDADVSPLATALRKGGGTYARTYRHLDGENQVIALKVECALTRESSQTIEVVEKRYATVFYTEVCESGGEQATNQYWVERGSGAIRQSRQWISPAVGMLFVQQVID